MALNRNQVLGFAAAGMFLTAAIAYRSLTRAESASERELLQQLGSVTYHVRCSGCNQDYEMPASDYTRAVSAAAVGDGVKCRKCGKRQAWRAEEIPEGNPLLTGFDVTTYTTASMAQEAKDKLGERIAEVRAKLESPSISSDEKAALISEFEMLSRKCGALDVRIEALQGEEPSR